MRALLLALLALPLAAARPAGPTYTRASIAGLTTAELYARLVGGADSGRLTGHSVREPFWPGGPLWLIDFYLAPRPLGADLCVRERLVVDLMPLKRTRPRDVSRDLPVRVNRVARTADLAFAHCRGVAGNRFIHPGGDLSLEDAAAILRRLGAARSAAAAPGALPFRMRCTTELSHERTECPPDLRGFLAGLPLDKAISVERAPFRTPALCGPPEPDSGDSVEVDVAGRLHVWEVRMREMGTGRAEVVLSWAPARQYRRC